VAQERVRAHPFSTVYVMRRDRLFSRHLLCIGFMVAAILTPLALTSVAQANSTTTSLAPVTGATITRLPLNSGATGGAATAISCTAPGQCVAGGVEYLGTMMQHAVLSTETNGIWGQAQPVGPGVSSNAGVVSIDHVLCPRMGSCLALGHVFSTGSTNSGLQSSSFLVVQHGSHWSAAQPIPAAGLGVHPHYTLVGMACMEAGWCVMTGAVRLNSTANRVFSLTWHNAKWGAPIFLSGTEIRARAKLMSLSALSCVGSWCEGVGIYTTANSLAAATGNNTSPYVVTYSGGRWHTMHALGAYPVGTKFDFLQSISCTRVGTCVAGGRSDPTMNGGNTTAVAIEELGGRWSAPYAVSFTGANVLTAVSCTKVSACMGILTNDTDAFEGVVTMSANHHWKLSTRASTPGWSRLESYAMSCIAGQCAIVGYGTQSAAGSLLPVVITPSAG
jgi:hypothetical protein